jgi:hypothetical protein
LSNAADGEARAIGALAMINEYVEAVQEGTVRYHAQLEALH